MFKIIYHRKLWFGLSGLLLAVSLVFIFVFGLKLGADFTGGTLIEARITGDTALTAGSLATKLSGEMPEVAEFKVQSSGDNQYLIRSDEINEAQHQQVLGILQGMGETEELRFESIGPTLGRELRDKSISALLAVSIFIVLFIAWSFRHAGQVVSSWKYGVGALIALAHDIVITTGIYALAGHFLGYQVDALFVTALLVVLGYSVNDTIVVYDRIRENILHGKIRDFEALVNQSLNDTMARSINTFLTTVLALLAVFLLGGASIKGFIFALLVGITVGVYSSIFVASPLLVVWEKLGRKQVR